MEIDLNILKTKAYKCAYNHGFHNEKISDETYLMLIITEISEAINAHRKNIHSNLVDFKYLNNTQPDIWKWNFEFCIKDTVEDELADVIIRLLDFAGAKKINLKTYDILCYDDNNFKGINSFCEKCYYICQLICNNSLKLEHKIKIILSAIFQLARIYSIDLIKQIELKMKYNELWPYKNGKSY